MKRICKYYEVDCKKSLFNAPVKEAAGEFLRHVSSCLIGAENLDAFRSRLMREPQAGKSQTQTFPVVPVGQIQRLAVFHFSSVAPDGKQGEGRTGAIQQSVRPLTGTQPIRDRQFPVIINGSRQ